MGKTMIFKRSLAVCMMVIGLGGLTLSVSAASETNSEVTSQTETTTQETHSKENQLSKESSDKEKNKSGESQILIPNVAQMMIGKNKTETNLVTISLPQDKPNVIPKTGGNSQMKTWLMISVLGLVAFGGSWLLFKRNGTLDHENH